MLKVTASLFNQSGRQSQDDSLYFSFAQSELNERVTRSCERHFTRVHISLLKLQYGFREVAHISLFMLTADLSAQYIARM
jgi:hypothetical protein